MSAMPEDFHDPARLVAAQRSLQRLLPAAGVGIQVRKRQRLGTMHAADQRSRSIARSSYAAALGLSKSAQPVLLSDGLLAVVARLPKFLASTHHPCLGLGGGRT